MFGLGGDSGLEQGQGLPPVFVLSREVLKLGLAPTLLAGVHLAGVLKNVIKGVIGYRSRR